MTKPTSSAFFFSLYGVCYTTNLCLIVNVHFQVVHRKMITKTSLNASEFSYKNRINLKVNSKKDE